MSSLSKELSNASTEVGRERSSQLDISPLAEGASPVGGPDRTNVQAALKNSVAQSDGKAVTKGARQYSPEALRLFNEITKGDAAPGDTGSVAASQVKPDLKAKDHEGLLHKALDDPFSSFGSLFAKLEDCKSLGDLLGVMRDVYVHIQPMIAQLESLMFSMTDDQFQSVLKKFDFSKISGVPKGIFAASADQDSPRKNGVGHYLGTYADAVGLGDLNLQAQIEKKLRAQDEREPIDLFDAKAAVVASIREKLSPDALQKMQDAISGLSDEDVIPFNQRKDYSDAA